MTYKYDKKTSLATEKAYNAKQIVEQRRATIAALAPKSGEQVVDVGCGPGMLLQDLAGEIGNRGRAIGIDSSPAMLDLARLRCETLGRVELLEGSATSLPLEDAQFDLATCVQVLLYVKEVNLALNELHRVLKPGGRVGVLETDWRSTVINTADIPLGERIISSWDATVSSPNLPASLAPRLLHAGFSDVNVVAIPVISRSLDGYAKAMIKQVASTSVSSGLLTRGQADEWLGEQRQLNKEGAFFFCVNRFLFSATKT